MYVSVESRATTAPQPRSIARDARCCFRFGQTSANCSAFGAIGSGDYFSFGACQFAHTRVYVIRFAQIRYEFGYSLVIVISFNQQFFFVVVVVKGQAREDSILQGCAQPFIFISLLITFLFLIETERR